MRIPACVACRSGITGLVILGLAVSVLGCDKSSGAGAWLLWAKVMRMNGEHTFILVAGRPTEAQCHSLLARMVNTDRHWVTLECLHVSMDPWERTQVQRRAPL